MVFSAYLLENAIWVLSSEWDICIRLLSPTVGFLYGRPTPLWDICSFSKTKWQMPGGMGTLGIEWAIIVSQGMTDKAWEIKNKGQAATVVLFFDCVSQSLIGQNIVNIRQILNGKFSH